MGNSRTKNVSRNTVVALFCQILNLLLNFITRTIFIKVLGAEYLGVNGLFTNVLTILSFAELGIGNAIIFSMYKPLAEKDEKKIQSLMLFYKKTYNLIGIIVGGVGIAIIPFLPYMINDEPNISDSIYLLYVLFLANTTLSYFFVYKKNMIIADQKNYIVLLITQLVIFLRIGLQTLFLFLTESYIAYLLIQIICTLLENIICSIVANRMYPFLKHPAEVLTKKETKKIFSDVKALAIYKFGSVILNGSDNILISALFGVRDVGLISNYVLLTSSCNAILSRVADAFTASVGNLNATEKSDKQYSVFKKIFFLTAWIYGYASVGLVIVAQKFIQTWIGEEYILSIVVLYAIVIEFYVKGVQFAAYTYRTTLGFFKQGKWSAFAAAIINIILSLVLCRYLGIAGIFIATPIARLLTTGLVDPILIYKRTFKINPGLYYLMYFGYVALFVLIGMVCNKTVQLINMSGWIGILVDAMVVTVLFNSLIYICFVKTQMFKEIKDSVLGIIRKRIT